MALDEFLLWVNGEVATTRRPRVTSKPSRPSPSTFKMGGSQSKDTDQTLTSMIDDATGTKFIYVPFKSGGEAAVQLAGGHIDSNTNNPNENIGQWKAGMVKPLCVFSPKRLARGSEGHADHGLVRHSDMQGSWHPGRSVPACRAQSGCPPDVPAERGGVLRGAEESQRDAGVEGIYRAHFADRALSDRRGTASVHRPTTRRRRTRCSSGKAGSFASCGEPSRRSLIAPARSTRSSGGDDVMTSRFAGRDRDCDRDCGPRRSLRRRAARSNTASAGASAGPEPGTFPFYVGLLVVAASVGNLVEPGAAPRRGAAVRRRVAGRARIAAFLLARWCFRRRFAFPWPLRCEGALSHLRHAVAGRLSVAAFGDRRRCGTSVVLLSRARAGVQGAAPKGPLEAALRLY